MRKTIYSSRGVSAVEFAILLPLLLAIVFGIIEFGLFMYNQQVITNAAREGARAAIVQGTGRLTPTEIQQIVMNYLRPPDGTGQWRLITFNTNPSPTIDASDYCTSSAWDATDYATVKMTVSTPYLAVDSMIKLATLGLGNLPPITLSTKAVMKCE